MVGRRVKGRHRGLPRWGVVSAMRGTEATVRWDGGAVSVQDRASLTVVPTGGYSSDRSEGMLGQSQSTHS